MTDLFGVLGLAEHCVFCFEPVEAVCSWPIKGFLTSAVGSLEVGDVCQNLGRTRMGTVARIRAVDAAGLLDVTVDRIRKVPGLARQDVYRWHKTAKILKLTTYPCGKGCCWRHYRDLGDGNTFICSEHWREQLEKIA